MKHERTNERGRMFERSTRKIINDTAGTLSFLLVRRDYSTKERERARYSLLFFFSLFLFFSFFRRCSERRKLERKLEWNYNGRMFHPTKYRVGCRRAGAIFVDVPRLNYRFYFLYFWISVLWFNAFPSIRRSPKTIHDASMPILSHFPPLFSHF